MTHRLTHLLPVALLALTLSACTQPTGRDTRDHEDREAKRLLQGSWQNDDDGSEAFLVSGDSIYYYDAACQPARLWVYQDSLYVEGATVRAYHIEKQADHLLRFTNVNGEPVTLSKGDGQPTATPRADYALNLSALSSSDTTATLGAAEPVKVSIYSEPTSDRIVKTAFSDIGMEVDNVYLDYAITVTLTGGITYTHTFRKAEFAQRVPAPFFRKACLRSITFTGRDAQGLHFDAAIGAPDSETCYITHLSVTRGAELRFLN